MIDGSVIKKQWYFPWLKGKDADDPSEGRATSKKGFGVLNNPLDCDESKCVFLLS